MAQNGDYVAGHAIFKDRNVNANQTLKDGLIIHDASRGIPSTARRFELKFEDNLMSLKDLSNVAEKEVVIIKLLIQDILNHVIVHLLYLKIWDNILVFIETFMVIQLEWQNYPLYTY